MAVTRFQDLIVWQRARELAGMIYVASRSDEFSRDFGLRDQARRSAVSIMANIAEGFGRNRPLEFIRFINIARGSCAELHSHLFVALDAGYLQPEHFERLERDCEDVGMLLRRLEQSIPHGPTRDEGRRTRDAS